MNLGNLKNSKLVLVGDNYTIVIPGRQTMEPNSSSYSKFIALQAQLIHDKQIQIQIHIIQQQ